MITFELYTRANCHLCELMRRDLEALTGGHGVRIDMIDIDADPGLAGRYGTRVPVLRYGGRELCHYHLDPAAVSAVIGRRET